MLLTKHISFGFTPEGKFDKTSKACGFYMYTETADNIHIVRMSVEGWDSEEFNKEFWNKTAPNKTVTEDPDADIWSSFPIDESSFEITVNGEAMATIITDKEMEETQNFNMFLASTGLSKEMVPSSESLFMLVKMFHCLTGEDVKEIYKYFS